MSAVNGNQMKRKIRIGNASGAVGDGLDQVYALAVSGAVDAITADYLAEFNIAWKAIERRTDPDAGYERVFLEQLAWQGGAGARAIAERGIKVVHNGGGLNPRGLAVAVDHYFNQLGVGGVKVAWVDGDDVTAQVQEQRLGALRHLDKQDTSLAVAGESILSANVYSGQRGIIAALHAGADIVICGRCCDASPVMGLASWWHNWELDRYDCLATCLMAGHLIECGAYVTGGNFCRSQEIEHMTRLGYPIAEIEADGTSTITKPDGTDGAVSVDTCTAQLLYEIQGHHYLNPDVVADISRVMLTQVGLDRVLLSGVRGLAPPSTAKVAVCLHGGFQAELSAYAAGIDTEDKFKLYRNQVTSRINQADFTTFSVEKYGSSPPDPKTQRECTVQIRVFAQSPSKAAFQQLRRAIFFNGMAGFCGLHLSMDWRTLEPKPYVKYFPAIVDQDKLPELRAHLLDGRQVMAAPLGREHTPSSKLRADCLRSPENPVEATDGHQLDGTVRRPLGDLLLGRSGDKGGNASIGLWARSAEGYQWALSYLTSSKMAELLGDDWDAEQHTIDRSEFPNILGILFVVKGILQEGVSSSSIVDGFAKSMSGFVRARLVDMPATCVGAEDARRAAFDRSDGHFGHL